MNVILPDADPATALVREINGAASPDDIESAFALPAADGTIIIGCAFAEAEEAAEDHWTLDEVVAWAEQSGTAPQKAVAAEIREKAARLRETQVALAEERAAAIQIAKAAAELERARKRWADAHAKVAGASGDEPEPESAGTAPRPAENVPAAAPVGTDAPDATSDSEYVAGYATTAQIRAWLASNGHDVAVHGRISEELREAYYAAHRAGGETA